MLCSVMVGFYVLKAANFILPRRCHDKLIDSTDTTKVEILCALSPHPVFLSPSYHCRTHIIVQMKNLPRAGKKRLIGLVCCGFNLSSCWLQSDFVNICVSVCALNRSFAHTYIYVVSYGRKCVHNKLCRNCAELSFKCE